MARLQARRQHRERLEGVLLTLLGVAVLVVAVFALGQQPKSGGHGVAADRSATARTVSPSVPAGKSAAPSASRTASGGTSGGTAGEPTIGLSGVAGAKHVPLVVLNNTTTHGLATQAADRFRSAGWTVRDTGNLSNDILSTCAYYDPSDSSAEAAAKALQQQFPIIKRVQQRFPELPSGPVVVVLTPDYQAG